MQSLNHPEEVRYRSGPAMTAYSHSHDPMLGQNPASLGHWVLVAVRERWELHFVLIQPFHKSRVRSSVECEMRAAAFEEHLGILESDKADGTTHRHRPQLLLRVVPAVDTQSSRDILAG